MFLFILLSFLLPSLFFVIIAVRQENERLIQESLNRAKFAANFTEPPTILPTTTPMNAKMLQSNFVP